MPESINLAQRIYLDRDGFCHPIVAMFDGDGMDCESPDAISAVAGSEGRWFALDLSEFNAGAFQ